MSTARESAPTPGFPAFVHSALQAAQYLRPYPVGPRLLVSFPFLGPTMTIDVDWKQSLSKAGATIERAVTTTIISRAVGTVARGEHLQVLNDNTPENVLALQMGLGEWIESLLSKPYQTDSELLTLLHTHVVGLVDRRQEVPIGGGHYVNVFGHYFKVFDHGSPIEPEVHLFVPGFPEVSTWGPRSLAATRFSRMVVARTVSAALEPGSCPPGMFRGASGADLRLAIMDWAKTQAPKQLSQASLE